MSLFGSFFSGIRVEDTALRTKPERAMRTFGLAYCCLELKMLWFTTKLFFFSLPKLTHVLYWSSGILTKKIKISVGAQLFDVKTLPSSMYYF